MTLRSKRVDAAENCAAFPALKIEGKDTSPSVNATAGSVAGRALTEEAQTTEPAPATPFTDVLHASGQLPSINGRRALGKDVPVAYLRTKEVSDLFQVTERTVQEWAKKGLLPVIRIGHTTRFKLSDVVDHVDEHCRVKQRRNMKGGRRHE